MRAVVVIALLLAAARSAHAGDLLCAPTEPDSIEVDGMLDDWEGVKGTRIGGKDKDASFEVRCLTDGDHLQLLIDVRDDLLSRRRATAKDLRGEDRVVVALAAGGDPLTMTLFPGTEKVAPRRSATGYAGKKAKKGKLPAGLLVEDSAQPKGWAIEIVVPLARIRSWSSGTATIAATVTLQDADELKEQPGDLTGELSLGFGAKGDLFGRLLKDARLARKDVKIDEVVDFDPGHEGRERVVAGGKVIGLIADRYSYLTLPVESAKDVLKIELVDLRGDGTRVVLTHLRQHGGGGSRDVVVLWGARDGAIEQLFAVEVRKEADGNRLESRWKLMKAGSKRKLKKGKKARGKELVVESAPAVGWDEDTFGDSAVDDAEPIHRPWDDQRSGGVYWLDGTTVRSQVLKAKKSKG